MVNTDIKYISKQKAKDKASNDMIADLIIITLVIGFIALNVLVYAMGNLASSYSEYMSLEQHKYDSFVSDRN